MKKLINDRLTEDEINELNKVLSDKNINYDDVGVKQLMMILT